jgi:ketosteroid isomerase-like protein
VFKDNKLTTSFTKTTTTHSGDTVIVEAIVETATNGTSKTRFQTRNLTTGKTTEIESTMKDETPYEAGNTVEIADINGTLYIKIVAPLDANLIVE